MRLQVGNAGYVNQIKLFQSIKEKVATLDRTVIITIDGCAGAGKTTLAKKIEADFEDVVTIHMDDLYRGWLLTLGPTLTRELISILDQLSEGGVVTYNKFDWHKDLLGEEVTFSAPKILILEGVGAGQLSISNYVDIKVWIDLSPEEGLARVLSRDGLGIKAEMERFRQEQEAHFTAEQTQERSDFQILGK